MLFKGFALVLISLIIALGTSVVAHQEVQVEQYSDRPFQKEQALKI